MKASEIIEKAANEGIKQYRGYYYNEKLTAYCAMGVIRKELGMCGKKELSYEEEKSAREKFHSLITNKKGISLFMDIMVWNDDLKLSFKEIAKKLRRRGL